MRKGLPFRFLQALLCRPNSHEIEGDFLGGIGGRRLHEGGGRRRGRRLEAGEKLLSDCKEGDRVVIRRLVGGGPLRRRLLEMGLTPGTEVRVVKYAPLRDPMECELKGYHIALRVSEALWIVVAQR